MKSQILWRVLCIMVVTFMLLSVCSCTPDVKGDAPSSLLSSETDSTDETTSSVISSNTTSSNSTSSNSTSSNGSSSRPTTSSKPSSDVTKVPTLPFSKGVNVNCMETFLSDNFYGSFERGIEVVTDESTYTNIKAQGFDHVRIPVNFYTAYYEAATGKYKYTTEEIMKYVDTGIKLATKHGLYVILDFHGWFQIGAEANDIEEFLYCWTQVAKRYKDYSDKLVFELLNEPWYTNGRPQPYLSDIALNKMQADAIKIIRNTGSKNKDRLIICCTADGNKAWKLSVLSLPDDDNLAVAIHEYEPYNFTHQNFAWAGLGNKTTTLAALGGFEKATSYDFGEIKKFMKKTGIPVVLNEFGVNLGKATQADIKTYLSGITTFCRDNNIPWTYWQYYDEYNSEGAMALYRKTSRLSKQEWDQTALDALFLR